MFLYDIGRLEMKDNRLIILRDELSDLLPRYAGNIKESFEYGIYFK